jgi:hypothetical protein
MFLDQKCLKMLLQEAANKDCSTSRRNDIWRILQNENKKTRMSCLMIYEGISECVAKNLYYETLRNRPETLPSFFPAFALLCVGGKVDWSLVD